MKLDCESILAKRFSHLPSFVMLLPTSGQGGTSTIIIKNNIGSVGSGTLRIKHCRIIIGDISRNQKQYKSTYCNILE